jgi:acetyl-CoA synthetase
MELITPRVKAFREAAREDPDEFWAAAADMLPWFRRWDRTFDWDAERPDAAGRYFRWFEGGRTNLAWNAVDRHVERGWGGHAAIVYETEAGGRSTLTYAQLLHEVRRTAAALRGLGVRKGDRVAIYMPTCPEAIVAMLACARIGAIHIVVFAGFGAGALRDRISLAGAKVVMCADKTFRKGKDVPLKGIVDDALRETPLVENVVVLQRGGVPCDMKGGRDLTWPEFLAAGEGQDMSHEEMESNEAAFILATSGTTARPKLAVHTHGGYQVHVHAMGDWVFGLDETDVWWSTSDIGWVVGHSYIVYAPLLAGCTTLAFEGALDHPGPETFYRIV